MTQRRIAAGLLASAAALAVPLSAAAAAGASPAPAARPAAPLTEAGLQGVSCAGSTCMAVGAVASGANAAALTERWSGTRWTALSTPVPATAISSHLLGVSCSSASACIAVGSYEVKSGIIYPLAEAWNGTAWSLQTMPHPSGSPQNSLVAVACSSPYSCVAVGTQTTPHVMFFSLAEYWNGSTWAIEATPTPSDTATSYLTGLACPSATSCVAVGYYENNQGVTFPLGELWNGAKWTLGSIPTISGTSSTVLSDVACSSPAACVAVGGDLPSKKGSVETAAAAFWNGSTWAVSSIPAPAGAKGTQLSGLACTSVYTCVAVGDYADSAGLLLPVSERWTGARWSVEATPDPTKNESSDLVGVSCSSASDCLAVGAYAKSASSFLPLTELWNGSKWAVRTTPN